MKKLNQELVSIAELVEINPSVSLNGVGDASEVSFIPMSDVTESGRWEIRQTRLLREVKNGYTQFQENDVLFAKITPCMENGKGCHAVGLINGIGFGTTEFHVLRAKENTDARFIFHLTQSLDLRLKAETKMSGSAGQQRVPSSFFSEYKIIAFDFEEQAKIAAVLTSIDKAIEQTEKLIAKQQRIKRGLLQDLLTKGIDEHGVIRSEATHNFKDSPLGRIPKEWEVKELYCCADAIDPQPDHRTPPAVADGFPYVGISDVLDSGEIDTRLIRKVSENAFAKQRKRFKVNDGDIIFGKIGTIGVPKKLSAKTDFALSANVILIKPNENKEFFYWMLVSPSIEQQVLDEIHTTSQPAFGIEKIRKLKVIYPPPDEQNLIAQVLDENDVSLKAETDRLLKLLKIKSGLMQDLLTGKVRVSGEQTN